jgi:2-haloacid dehalogenase
MPSKIGTAGVVATRPVAVAFDVIETLMPLEPLRERFTAAGLPAHLLELWFARTPRDRIMLATTGDYAPFGEVAALRCGSPPALGRCGDDRAGTGRAG